MTTSFLVAALSALTLTAAACAGGAVGRDVAVDDTAVVVEPQPGQPGDPGGGPQFVLPRPGMADVAARQFDSATVGDDDRTVTVLYWSGVEPCAVLDRVEVEESDTQVAITLFEGHDPAAGDVACIEIAVQKGVVVQLPSLLAGRSIVDGATGKAPTSGA
ncbi:MAG TPA: hypothetical protein VHF25_02055 [Nitriliruptorales bacterium]|nr:hypothetical protein [Nitriliruptorales bacterium]